MSPRVTCFLSLGSECLRDLKGFKHGNEWTMSRYHQRVLRPKHSEREYSSSLSGLRRDVQGYIKDVFSKRREAATHVMVFMIADERRDLKPYAIPVRALPFKSIKDAKLRELRDELKATMGNLGMVVVDT
ncbi:uncharacterized protein LOC110054822 [Orbicella faveolata]|uniref:uncharacterized protein LOC110054822 n=1 Tax=Orbicella faveolata TaxID=48498 RepID=UPI0009E607F1|nr:uncharacterized protein LOC110054822 [Orbicella faveolata]